jgi:hypothetical protein
MADEEDVASVDGHDNQVAHHTDLLGREPSIAEKIEVRGVHRT